MVDYQYITQVIQEALMEITSKDREELHDDIDVYNDLGLDSLDIAELCVMVESELNIDVETDDFHELSTIGEFAIKVESKIAISNLQPSRKPIKKEEE